MPESVDCRFSSGCHPPFWLLAALLLSPVIGCASLCRNPVSNDVVAARQISLKGIEAMEQGRWEEAEALFASAIETYPADERAHRRYAELLWRRGERDNAILHMERCIRLSGGDPNLRVRLGEMHLSYGNTGLAQRQSKRAILGNRDSPAAWALRGDVLRRQGKLGEAMVSYHRALSFQEHYPHVQTALAEIYQQRRRPRRVLSTLDSLVASQAKGKIPQRVLYLQGLAFKELQRYDDSIASLAAAAERGEPHVDLLYHLSEAKLLSGDAANARLVLQAALARAPDHGPSRELEARISRRLKDVAAAR